MVGVRFLEGEGVFVVVMMRVAVGLEVLVDKTACVGLMNERGSNADDHSPTFQMIITAIDRSPNCINFDFTLTPLVSRDTT